MGFRDWLPGSGESPQEAADRLRSEALADAGAVDATRLVELFREAETRSVARSAAKGIEAVARERPDRLADDVPTLLAATQSVDDVGAAHRGELGVAVQRVADVAPETVADNADALRASLEAELEADERPGHDVRLDEEKTAALCRAVGAAEVGEARPLLLRLSRHPQAEVGEAAKAALREL
jgi:hypothetical protein